MPQPETLTLKIVRIVATPIIAITFAFLLFNTKFLASYENRIYDLQYRLRGPEADEPQRVVIVEIDDASLSRHGAWPWPRILLARLLSRIAEGSPRVVGVDLLLDLPESARKDGDRELARLFSAHSRWVLPAVLSPARDGAKRTALLEPLPLFMTSNSAQGAVNLEPDESDRAIRRFCIEGGDGRLSFAAAVIAAADSVPPASITAKTHRFVIGDRSIPLAGGRVFINYKGVKMEHYSAADVMDDYFDPELFFKDRIVLVGRTDLASKDFFPTSMPGVRLLETESMAGVRYGRKPSTPSWEIVP